MRAMSMIRGVIQKTTAAAGKLLRVSVSGRTNETIDDREALQHYGLQSRPPKGAEALLMRRGNVIMVFASDDRSYRISLDEGEVALATDEGDVIHLKRDHKIEITAGNALAAGEITINAEGVMTGKVTVNAGGAVNVSAPTVRLGGLALDTALGIVTGACSCSITGAVHPVTSQTAKATL